MKKAIKGTINKEVHDATPNSITLVEWFSNKENCDYKSFYKDDVSIDIHERSIDGRNSSSHYLDYKLIEVEYYHGMRYFDDLSFKEELQHKEMLVDFRRFFSDKLNQEQTIKLLWILNEVERNIRNHAYPMSPGIRKMSYVAKYYTQSTGDKISINISDYGMGFEKRRSEITSYSILYLMGVSDTEHYVLNAVQPKITTRTNHMIVSDPGSANSGYGLYMLNQISSHPKNKLEILSDGKLFRNKYNDKHLRYASTNDKFKGITSISFDICINTIDDAFEKLSRQTGGFSNKSNFSKSILNL